MKHPAKLTLACTVCQQRNYTTPKPKVALTQRLTLNKFCKHCNAHTPHVETK
jgi:large subunit ribosomal protein L33